MIISRLICNIYKISTTMKKGRFYSWCLVVPVIYFAFACNTNNPQNRDASSTNDSSFSGIYKYGTTAKEGRFGVLYVYPVSDTTMLIYLELSRGKPSYNSGALYSAIHLNSNGVAYFKKEDKSYLDCSIKFLFKKDFVEIITDSTHRKCPFGYGVYADGNYRKVSYEIPQSFINRHADTVYFKTLIERYEKGEPISYSD